MLVAAPRVGHIGERDRIDVDPSAPLAARSMNSGSAFTTASTGTVPAPLP